MPKPPDRYNKARPFGAPTPVGRAPKPINLSDLLAKSKISGREVSQLSDRQRYWRDFLGQRLQEELFRQITGIVEQEGRLSVFASSPAWSARLRFAMAELWPEVSATHAALQTWVVKVQPKAAETWGART